MKGAEARYEGVLKKEAILASLRGEKDESHTQGYRDGTEQKEVGMVALSGALRGRSRDTVTNDAAPMQTEQPSRR